MSDDRIADLETFLRRAEELLSYVTYHDGRYDQHTRHEWQRQAQEFLGELRRARQNTTVPPAYYQQQPSGSGPTSTPVACPDCGGSGWIEEYRDEKNWSSKKCERCCDDA